VLTDDGFSSSTLHQPATSDRLPAFGSTISWLAPPELSMESYGRFFFSSAEKKIPWEGEFSLRSDP
jgi:hypothetical protein